MKQAAALTLALVASALALRAQVRSSQCGPALAAPSVWSWHEVTLPDRERSPVAVATARDSKLFVAYERQLFVLAPDGWQLGPPDLNGVKLRALGRVADSDDLIVGTSAGAYVVSSVREPRPDWAVFRLDWSWRRIEGAAATRDIVRVLPASGPVLAALLVDGGGGIHPVLARQELATGPRLAGLGKSLDVEARVGPDGMTLLFARGGEAVAALDENGQELWRIPIVGGGALRDLVVDGDRALAFAATSAGTMAARISADGPPKWFSLPALAGHEVLALGSFAGRLLVVCREPAVANGSLLLLESYVNGADESPAGEDFLFVPAGNTGGPSSIRAATQVDTDVVWAIGDEGVWEWRPDAWVLLGPNVPAPDLHAVQGRGDRPVVVRSQDGARLFACLPRRPDGWTVHDVAADRLVPDATGRGVWAIDEATATLHFVSPNGALLVPPPPATVPSIDVDTVVEFALASGDSLWPQTEDGELVLRIGGRFARLRGGAARWLTAADWPQDLESLAVSGSINDSPFVGIGTVDGQRGILAVDCGDEELTATLVEPLPAWALHDARLVQGADGDLWLAARDAPTGTTSGAEAWQVARYVISGLHDPIELGPLPEPPRYLFMAEPSSFEDLVVLTEHGLARGSSASSAGLSWRRLFEQAGGEVGRVAAGFARVGPALDLCLLGQRAAAGARQPARGYTFSRMSKTVTAHVGPAGLEDGMLVAVFPERAGAPVRLVWASDRTTIERIGENPFTYSLDGFGAARCGVEFEQPGTLDLPEWSTRMLALCDGQRVAIQHLGPSRSWHDQPFAVPVAIEISMGADNKASIRPLEEPLPAALPAGVRSIEFHLAPDYAHWWGDAPTGSVSLGDRVVKADDGGRARVSVQPDRDYTISLLASDLGRTTSMETRAWNLHTAAVPIEPSDETPAWLLWGLPTLLCGFALALWLWLRGRDRTPAVSRNKRDAQGGGGLPADVAVHTFVCYSRKDGEFAETLAASITAEGVDRGVGTWMDQRNIPKGSNWDRCIDDAIERCRWFLIVLSPDSVDSIEVQGELRRALDHGKALLPVLLRPCVVPRQILNIERLEVNERPADDPGLVRTIVDTLAAEDEDWPSADVRVFFEGFDAPEHLSEEQRGIWLVEGHESWTTGFEHGVLTWTNLQNPTGSLQSTLRYHLDDVEVELGNARVRCLVKVGGPSHTHSGAGLMFRYDAQAERGYAFFAQPGGAVTLYRRESTSMRPLWSTADVPSDARGFVQLEIDGHGRRLRFRIGGHIVHSLSDAEWLDGKPGVAAYSIGEFQFDDVVLYRR